MKTEFHTKDYRTLITADRLEGLCRCASMVPDGYFWAECGVYKGGSLKCLADNFPEQLIVGFDTFEGLPKEHWEKSETHEPGEFSDTDIFGVANYINTGNVGLKKGLFPESALSLSDQIFSFVHVDFDFRLGVKAALDFFWPRMVEYGIMVFDDYGWPNCPGVERALRGYKPIPTANFQVAIIK